MLDKMSSFYPKKWIFFTNFISNIKYRMINNQCNMFEYQYLPQFQLYIVSIINIYKTRNSMALFKIYDVKRTPLGRVLAYGFPLTEFGGFHGPSSANSKLFHGSEFQLVKDRGNNKNSSSIV